METAPRVSTHPKVVLGMPAYSRPDVLARTLESLLSQTCSDFALVIVDDDPRPETAAIVETYRRDFPRVTYEANERRLGMVENWRKTFRRARERYPASPYFAWVSDHDVWHARWLHEMVSVLDACPEVVLAYPQNFRMMADEGRIAIKVFETFGMSPRADRMRTSARYMLAGDMIYGLVRADALEAAGIFRRVITPDRQVLLALSLFGQVKQVREVLWYREMLRVFDIDRQRGAFFPDGVPLYAYAPSHLQHFVVLLWDFGVRGRGRPGFGRLAGAYFASLQLWWSIVRVLTQPKAEWRLAARRAFARVWEPSPESSAPSQRDDDTAAGALEQMK
jgi:glycosyltransferase involved in cell wall biosynthesis